MLHVLILMNERKNSIKFSPKKQKEWGQELQDRIVFYDRVTVLMDVGGETHIIYLDLWKTSDSVPHHI